MIPTNTSQKKFNVKKRLQKTHDGFKQLHKRKQDQEQEQEQEQKDGKQTVVTATMDATRQNVVSLDFEASSSESDGTSKV